jgi:hypothetical protein
VEYGTYFQLAGLCDDETETQTSGQRSYENHWKPNQSDVCLDRIFVNDVGRRSITGMERSRFLR